MQALGIISSTLPEPIKYLAFTLLRETLRFCTTFSPEDFANRVGYFFLGVVAFARAQSRTAIGMPSDGPYRLDFGYFFTNNSKGLHGN
jgi:hypothetical protein